MELLLATYHEVAQSDTRYVYSIAAARFAEHVQALAPLRANSDLPVLSFDDGHTSTYDIALPILIAHNCPAIHFLSAGWIGRRDGFMGWEQVRELHRLGHQIESHSWSHPFLTDCGDDELEHELTRSKEAIEDRIGAEVSAVSMPGGRWDMRVIRACALAGYQRVYVSDPFFRTRIVDGVEVVGRLMVSRTMTAQGVRRWVSRGHRTFGAEWLRRRSKDMVRNALGDSVYHILWRTLGGAGHSLQGRS